MPFKDLTTSFPKKDGKYYVEIYKIFGFQRVADAIWQNNDGFITPDYQLKEDEFIKTWWAE